MRDTRRSSRARLPVSTMLLLILIAGQAAAFGGLKVYSARLQENGAAMLAAAASAPQVQETEPPEQTQPPETTAPAEPDDPAWARSYTIAASESAAVREQVVASAGEARLTNAGLQIGYMAQVTRWQAEEHANQPDLTRPLDAQICPEGDGTQTWQQFFLSSAVSDWYQDQAAAYAAAQPQPITEEAYQPIAEKHEEYITPDLPVNDFLYADKDCYTPNSVHQAWLDALPDTIAEQARLLGDADADTYAARVYGAGVTAADLQEAAEARNLAYMYYTEASYEAEPDSAAVERYYASHRSELTDTYGNTRTADIRHVLLLPANAKVTADGSVTAAEKDWQSCKVEAEQMLSGWKINWLTNQDAGANFARMANENSVDAGSQINGGLYSNVSKGQLIEVLDKWIFASECMNGDTAVLRSELGIHIVYVQELRSSARDGARTELIRQQMEATVRGWLDALPLTVDYRNAALWCDTTAAAMDPDALLYPDIAHERFPEAITYLQQDYMQVRYGGSYVGTGGCGITTMAMLATYMTDQLYTPAMLATRYPEYHVESGTNGDIFRYVPAELGFYFEKSTGTIDDVIEALRNGQRVIALETLGVFTRGGHYLLLQKYYEDTGLFQVRDSNIYNYGRLSGHKIDAFTSSDIMSGLSIFYILQNKIVRIPACARCGDTFAETAPELLLNSSYTCEKCQAALERRNDFLQIRKVLNEELV